MSMAKLDDSKASHALALVPVRHPLMLQLIVLLLACIVTFGSNYCYHVPAALKNQMQQHFSEIIDKDAFEVLFNMLYALYAFPNIVLPFFAGYLVDRFGSEIMLLILACTTLVGQAVMAFGTTLYSFRMMLVGRMIYSIGAEGLNVARTTFIAGWFKKKDLALTLGVCGSFQSLALVINQVYGPIFADEFGVSFAIWISAMMCAVSVAAAAMLIPIDRAAQDASSLFLPNGQPRPDRSNASIRFSDIKCFGTMFWLIVLGCVGTWGSIIPFQSVSSSLLLERDYFRDPPTACSRCGEGVYANMTVCTEVSSACPASPPFAWPLPKLSADCDFARPLEQLGCSTTAPYIDESMINCDRLAWKNGPITQIYCAKKIIAEEQASQIMGVPNMIALVASPFVGYAVGSMSYRGVLVTISSGFVLLSQVLIAVTDMSIGVLLFIQGAASCLFFSVCWPSIPYVVEEHYVGTAYGLVGGAGNFFLSFLPLLVAGGVSYFGKYLPMVQLGFAAIALVAFLASIGLYIMEKKHGRLLNPPTPYIHQGRRTSLTGSLWGPVSPSTAEREQLLRASPHADYKTMPAREA